VNIISCSYCTSVLSCKFEVGITTEPCTPSFETLARADHEHKVASHQPLYNYYAWSLCHSVYMYSGLIHFGDGDSLGLGYLLGLLGGQVVKMLDYRPRGPRFLPPL